MLHSIDLYSLNTWSFRVLLHPSRAAADVPSEVAKRPAKSWLQVCACVYRYTDIDVEIDRYVPIFFEGSGRRLRVYLGLFVWRVAAATVLTRMVVVLVRVRMGYVCR